MIQFVTPFITKIDKMNKMNKMIHFVSPSIEFKRQNEFISHHFVHVVNRWKSGNSWNLTFKFTSTNWDAFLEFAIEKFSFDQYNIGSIRFELYNLYIKVKHKRIDLFQPLIDFLIEFNASFPETIEEKLYFRVLFSLQALVKLFIRKVFLVSNLTKSSLSGFQFIYNSLMNDDLKTTSKLIKEYFPKDTTLTTSSNQNVTSF